MTTNGRSERGPGRPRKGDEVRTESNLHVFERSTLAGFSVATSALLLGTTERTLFRWLEDDEEARDRIRNARQQHLFRPAERVSELVESENEQIAFQASKFILQTRSPDHREKVETGTVDDDAEYVTVFEEGVPKAIQSTPEDECPDDEG